MSKKCILYTLIVVFILVLILPVHALNPQPRVELDKSLITVSSIEDVYVEGSVSIARGQWIQLHANTSGLPINYTDVPNSNKKERFRLSIPKQFLHEGTNTFYIISRAVNNKLSASNFETITINVNNKETNIVTKAAFSTTLTNTNIKTTIKSGKQNEKIKSAKTSQRSHSKTIIFSIILLTITAISAIVLVLKRSKRCTK